jgi:septum site-determining protein MinC
MIEAEKQTSIQIKGIKDGLLITMSAGEDWEQQKTDLLEQITQKGNFFKGAKITLDVSSQVILSAEMGDLRDKLSDRGVTLWAVLSHSAVTDRTSQMMGLATKLASTKVEKAAIPVEKKADGESAVLVQRTVRSGACLQHDGSITILGDVNPGGEVEAGGSVIVWGKLKGKVNAGKNGNDKAMICALDFHPLGFSIAGQSGTLPVKEKSGSQPVTVCLQDGILKVDTWKPQK